MYFFVSACVEALLTAPASQSIPMTFLSLVIAGMLVVFVYFVWCTPMSCLAYSDLWLWQEPSQR